MTDPVTLPRECALCDLPIRDGERCPVLPKYHAFCGQIVKGECMDALDEALRDSPDYVEIRPGIWQHKDYVKPEPRPETR